MKLYTIGYGQKSAEQFFGLLRANHIQRLVDIRRRPGGQLAGYAQQRDLPYFLRHLVDGCEYAHRLELAPTHELLDAYHQNRDWSAYVDHFRALLDERQIPHTLDRAWFEEKSPCLVCVEPAADQCHRRLVAERIASVWPDVEIIHL